LSEGIGSRDLVLIVRGDENVVRSDVLVGNLGEELILRKVFQKYIVGLEVSAGRGNGVQQVPELSFREVFFVTSSFDDLLFEISFETFKEDGELVEVSAENLVLLAVVTVGSQKVGVSESCRVSDSSDLLFKFLRRV